MFLNILMILSLSLTVSADVSSDTAINFQPTRKSYTYVEKSLEQLLPTPEERADQLIRTITSKLSLLQNDKDALSKDTMVPLVDTFSDQFLDRLFQLSETGQVLRMPAHALPIITGEVTVEVVDERDFTIQSQSGLAAYHITMDFPHYKLLNTSPPVVDLTQGAETLTEDIVSRMKKRDYVTLSQYIHPGEGLTVTPYLYVDDEAVTFTKQQVSHWLSDDSKYLFGYNDGRGDPINVTPITFIERFIETPALTEPDDIIINGFSTHGNSLNNTEDAFPDLSTVVEYHHDGTDEYVGMDWRSLHFVFKEIDGYMYLRAILSDQWTI